MNIIVLSCAEFELAEAIAYYNEQLPGLGFEFAAEVRRSFAHIQNYPEAWSIFSGRSRRCLIDRFPYAILFQIRKENILVGGIMHLSRNPKSFRDRFG